jgi:2-oxoglutarate ferredoxin oxidoreductase subunit alpha
MTRLRAAKIAGIARDIPLTDVDDEDGAEVLVIGWGSTYGAIAAGVQRVRARGHKVAQAHLVHLNPFPSDLGEVLSRYKRVLVPEVNLGQLSRLLRAEYLVDAISFTQVQGIPFRAAAMESAILQQIEGAGSQFAVEELDGSDGGSNDASNGADPSGANPNGAATDKRTSER